MEIRKLQKTGGSSFTITLPKKWVDDNDLNDKGLIQIVSPQPHILVLQTTNIKKRLFKSQLNIGNLTDNMLTRELIAHYISGVDEIIVKSHRISPDQRNKIRELSNFLTGFEIIDESSEKIVLKNIFDPAKFPITKKIEKIFLTTTSMFKDVLRAIAENDKTLARDVIQRDFEIDKLHLVIKRQRHSLEQNRISQEEIGMSLGDLHYYEDVATQLERIADHAVKIARTISISGITLQKVHLSRSVTAVADQISLLLNKSYDMVKTMNKTLAHEILDITSKIKSPTMLTKKDHEETFILNLIEDSLDRVRGYTTNIAEITIDQSIERG